MREQSTGKRLDLRSSKEIYQQFVSSHHPLPTPTPVTPAAPTRKCLIRHNAVTNEWVIFATGTQHTMHHAHTHAHAHGPTTRLTESFNILGRSGRPHEYSPSVTGTTQYPSQYANTVLLLSRTLPLCCRFSSLPYVVSY